MLLGSGYPSGTTVFSPLISLPPKLPKYYIDTVLRGCSVMPISKTNIGQKLCGAVGKTNIEFGAKVPGFKFRLLSLPV